MHSLIILSVLVVGESTLYSRSTAHQTRVVGGMGRRDVQSRSLGRTRSLVMEAKTNGGETPYFKGLDAYGILGLTRTASKKEIKAAYRKAVGKWHPDKFTNNEEGKLEGGQRMEKINRAYFCLEDEDRKRRYDLYGEKGVGTSASSEKKLKESADTIYGDAAGSSSSEGTSRGASSRSAGSRYAGSTEDPFKWDNYRKQSDYSDYYEYERKRKEQKKKEQEAYEKRSSKKYDPEPEPQRQRSKGSNDSYDGSEKGSYDGPRRPVWGSSRYVVWMVRNTCAIYLSIFARVTHMTVLTLPSHHLRTSPPARTTSTISVTKTRASLILMYFRGLYLCTISIAFSAEWCMGKVYCSSITFYSIVNIKYNHRSHNDPFTLPMIGTRSSGSGPAMKKKESRGHRAPRPPLMISWISCRCVHFLRTIALYHDIMTCTHFHTHMNPTSTTRIMQKGGYEQYEDARNGANEVDARFGDSPLSQSLRMKKSRLMQEQTDLRMKMACDTTDWGEVSKKCWCIRHFRLGLSLHYYCLIQSNPVLNIYLLTLFPPTCRYLTKPPSPEDWVTWIGYGR